MALNFGGISSGIDTSLLIQSIMEQEYRPVMRLQDRQALNAQKKTVLSSIKTSLMSLATSLTSLNATAVDRRTITSSDNNIVSATGNGALAGQYDLVVKQLATKARAEASPIDRVTDPKGQGFGVVGEVYTVTNKDGDTFDFDLKEGKTSLADLAAQINANADAGVTASVVQKNPGQYILALSSTETGLGKDGGDSTVSISGNAFGINEQTESAKNAKLSLNGVDIERSSNTIKDVIDGVTLTLKQADPEKTVNLTVAMDKEFITKGYQEIVDKFNAVLKVYKDASGKGGPLEGDSSLRTMFSQLKSSLAATIEGPGGSVLGGTAGIGLSTNRDGTLALDTKKLSDALDQNPDLVGQIFQKVSSTATDFIDKLTLGQSASINATITNIDTQNRTLERQIEESLLRLDRRKELLTVQFARMESMLGQLQAAGQSLGSL